MKISKDIATKFPKIIQDAIEKDKSFFSEEVRFKYKPFTAYRKVEKANFDQDDFKSYAELGKTPRGRQYADSERFACSFFEDIDLLKVSMHLNKSVNIAKGKINDQMGPCLEGACSHVNVWFYKNVDVVSNFVLIERKKKNE